MTDDGLLSQDDIDALLSAAPAVSGQGAPATASDARAGLDPESLRTSLTLMADQMRTVIATVVGREVEVELNGIHNNASGALSDFPEGGLCLKTGFESGLSGGLRFLLTRKDTALLADLMMMGDGTASYHDDHRDALSELGNQIMGTVATAFSAELEVSVGAGQGETSEFKSGSLSWTPEDQVQADFKIEIQGFPPAIVKLLIDVPLAQRLAREKEPSRVLDFTKATQSAFNGGNGDSSYGSSGSGPFGNSTQTTAAAPVPPNVQMLLDIPLNITIELGRSNLSIRRVLELGPGSIIELDHMASEPVDLLVNDKVVAKGEVVVIDEYFGIRIISLVSPEERIKNLQ